jgi:phytoene dehydrogenase-like protein
MAVASPFFHSLSLEHFGLEWIQPPAAVVHPLGGEPPAMLERSLDASLSTLSPDESNYRRLLQPLLRDWQSLVSEILATPLHLPSHPFAMLNFGRYAILSAAALNRLCFRGERARALFAGLASHSITSLEPPGSSAVSLVMAITAHAVGWRFPRCAGDRLYDLAAPALRARFEPAEPERV